MGSSWDRTTAEGSLSDRTVSLDPLSSLLHRVSHSVGIPFCSFFRKQPKRYDSLPPVPPHFVAFVWRYLRVHSFFSLLGGRVRRRDLELASRYLRPGLSLRKRQDLPSSWGTPLVRLPCSVDAGRTAGTRPLRCRSVAPGIRKAEAPTKGLSTLHSRAFGLAVYASPGGLPRFDARLASSCWSDATGWAFTRRVPTKGFRVLLTSHPPSPSFAWRNLIDRGVSDRSKLSVWWCVYGQLGGRFNDTCPVPQRSGLLLGGIRELPAVRTVANP
jgi:hypothetical protein